MLQEFLTMCIRMNRPVYTSFTMLDVSKVLMYNFHYNHMLKKYGRHQLCLLFTDTDSFCYQVYTQNIYEDMKEDVGIYDTSNYAPHTLSSQERMQKSWGK